ncbi:PEP-CTERM sorting domain-containing protein [Spirulina sp. CS-785/01]|nr:PEP-CTERM sorting domain-containing protein [Spirulina sp. CS-785/01]MDB9313653.1 PEP-CTERM sorting domain-containing protein [Spirulina sp. CS-785/01]
MEDDPVADVPEPGTILALGGIVFGAAGLRRKTQ